MMSLRDTYSALRAVSSAGRAVRRTSDRPTVERLSMERVGVYILKCSNGRYYVGSTQNIEIRYAEHAAGRVKATRNLLPVEIALFQPCNTVVEARQLEYRVKQLKSRKIIDRMVADQEINMA